MNALEARRATWRVARQVRRLRLKTADAYADQVAAFIRWCVTAKAAGSNEQKASAYLSACAPSIAASTQNQKLCALLFFFEHVVRRPLGDLGEWTYAKRPKRLPVWLTRAETRRVLDLMTGTHQLMARVTYGSGLRLMECVRLRVQHVDLEKGVLAVIGAKGDKDRYVPLARSCVPPLAEHLRRVRALWEGDRSQGANPVKLPDGLEAKYPNGGKQWPWFWLFPARRLSLDVECGLERRHHACAKVYSRALQRAASAAGTGKRVTMHVLRHSFATHLLERGVPVTTLQRLLGHQRLETTVTYLHCLPHLIAGTKSPLDDDTGDLATTPYNEPFQLAS